MTFYSDWEENWSEGMLKDNNIGKHKTRLFSFEIGNLSVSNKPFLHSSWSRCKRTVPTKEKPVGRHRRRHCVAYQANLLYCLTKNIKQELTDCQTNEQRRRKLTNSLSQSHLNTLTATSSQRQQTWKKILQLNWNIPFIT